ncbi:choice-of-anchor B family protein [Puniceicoccaceae bacterium K14]|nr:choice-of-anchor B family protein [Puniceicoccaceae bacterium K14]
MTLNAAIEVENVDFESKNIKLLSQLSLAQTGGTHDEATANDVWGWTDPVTGIEYVLLGRSDGVAMIQIEDPQNPIFLGLLPLTPETQTFVNRDVKVYKDNAYVIADNNVHGLQIFDLTQLRNISEPPVVFTPTNLFLGVEKAHNITINEETGYCYLSGYKLESDTLLPRNGLMVLDLNQEIDSPNFLQGTFKRARLDGDSYTHDAQVVIYRGPDEQYQGEEIAFCSNAGIFLIVDVSDKSRMREISNATYPEVNYIHQGWLTEDHHYFISNDEHDDDAAGGFTTTHIWDVSSLDFPRYIGAHVHNTTSKDHNLHIHNGLLYEANYTTGLRILEMTDLENAKLEEIAYIDTHPENDDDGIFAGAWGVYPFFESGTIAIGDMERGLILVQLQNPLSVWTSKYFTEEELQDPNQEETLWGYSADPDHDRLNNLMEFSIDSNPLTPTPQSGMSILLGFNSSSNNGDQQHLTPIISIRSRSDYSNLIFHLESSTNLMPDSWDNEFSFLNTEGANDNQWRIENYIPNFSMESDSRRFFRYSVELID